MKSPACWNLEVHNVDGQTPIDFDVLHYTDQHFGILKIMVNGQPLNIFTNMLESEEEAENAIADLARQIEKAVLEHGFARRQRLREEAARAPAGEPVTIPDDHSNHNKLAGR
jgi:hypothetical protein